MADLTVGDMLSAWARTVVPTAVIAAVVAALVLVRAAPVAAPARATVEELLLVGVEDDAFPAALSGDEEAASAVAFAGERF
jgi:hypothetical protein